MGYFDVLASGIIRKDERGSTVFYPWGVLGKGRLLPDEAAEKKVFRFVKFCFLVALVLAVGGAFFPWWYSSGFPDLSLGHANGLTLPAFISSYLALNAAWLLPAFEPSRCWGVVRGRRHVDRPNPPWGGGVFVDATYRLFPV
jgi:hypothetical protein